MTTTILLWHSLLKEKADDAVAVNRDAMEMRPLSMKNCFNKVIMSANCNALNSEYIEITNESQNGFTGGRSFLKHIVANDSAGRMYSCAYEGSKKPFLVPSTIPISAAYDFEVAFPSVIHLCIWAVLRHRNCLFTSSIFLKPVMSMLKLFFSQWYYIQFDYLPLWCSARLPGLCNAVQQCA